jgi:hypothetical protein
MFFILVRCACGWDRTANFASPFNMTEKVLLPSTFSDVGVGAILTHLVYHLSFVRFLLSISLVVTGHPYFEGLFHTL